MAVVTTREARARRHRRVRGKVAGTADRPRLAVFRSNRGIEAQLIDDVAGKTLAAASWLQLEKSFSGNKSEQAGEIGKLLARNAKKAAAWYIDTTEDLGKRALKFEERNTEWLRDTPLAPILEARRNLTSEFVERSAEFARNLWQLEKKEDVIKRV